MPKEKSTRTRTAGPEESAAIRIRREFTCCVHCGVPKLLHAELSAAETNPHEFVGAKP